MPTPEQTRKSNNKFYEVIASARNTAVEVERDRTKSIFLFSERLEEKHVNAAGRC